MRVLAVNHLSLDGVLQGPGRPDEDTRDGFRHGGWAQEEGLVFLRVKGVVHGEFDGVRGRGHWFLLGLRTTPQLLSCVLPHS